MGMFGRIVHISFDLVLVSTVLAGVKRSAGYQPKLDSIESKDIKNAVTKYLDVGEWVLNTTTAFVSTSGYFEKK